MNTNGTITQIHTGGTLTDEATEAALKVLPQTPPSGSLGGVLRNALLGLAINTVICVDFTRKSVSVYASAAFDPIIAAVSDGVALEDTLNLAPADDSKSSSPWTVVDRNVASLVGSVTAAAITTPLALMLDKSFGPGPSSKTVQSVVDSIEGALTDASVQLSGILVFGQSQKVVQLYVRDTAGLGAISTGATSAANFIATYLVTPAASAASGVGMFQL